MAQSHDLDIELSLVRFRAVLAQRRATTSLSSKRAIQTSDLALQRGDVLWACSAGTKTHTVCTREALSCSKTSSPPCSASTRFCGHSKTT
ncbi:hypothetical protein PsYK624_119930 [Phanerochaete sordida]|uniref:Uncharacterized protein n=1 Tax=Phanerochaete sordida TaxID=48140 RepID=A0A9P3GLP8_9APHY|nr:hypothetical protein PsYK624_119930 [Phanerochaete sordida]